MSNNVSNTKSKNTEQIKNSGQPVQKKCQCEEMKKQIEEMKKQKDEYYAKYMRALADYQNFEKRVVEQRKELFKTANKDLILKLLPFIDNLEKAEIFIQDKNLSFIRDSFFKILKDEGLKEIEVLGIEYDPYTAEVIEMVDGEKENIVVDVLRKGYSYNDSIIRIAQVKVSKKTHK